ncbi:MAG: hypothetical protein M1830_005434 [Pleopsidium flavum]|nr:MAG: hypothetical protein M1830_005434 [Pleopsidium flavum]
MATASEVSEFVATQAKLITEDHDNRVREADEAAIALEKRLAQKERVEAEVVELNEEKETLREAVKKLIQEKEDLANQKMKLGAEVSSLETALHIRREELHLMESRAEGLERRILEGVLDHSRSLLISKPTSTKGMNLKRVPSSASSATTVTQTGTAGPAAPSTIPSSAVGMALKRRQPTRANPAGPNKGDRRILSLSQITGNAPANNQLTLAQPSGLGDRGLGNLKRSHSVKSNFPVRKSSWSGHSRYDRNEVLANKENSVLDEADEEGESESDTGTERRTSYGTGSERRTSYSGTYTDSYGTGSTVSGEEERRRRRSYATSTVGTVGRDVDSESDHDPGRDEDNEDEEEGRDGLHALPPAVEGNALAVKGEMSNAGEMVVFGHPSDSGIGTDVPTAALDGGGSDYFRRG